MLRLLAILGMRRGGFGVDLMTQATLAPKIPYVTVAGSNLLLKLESPRAYERVLEPCSGGRQPLVTTEKAQLKGDIRACDRTDRHASATGLP